VRWNTQVRGAGMGGGRACQLGELVWVVVEVLAPRM
jgi:hypothetical protein